MKNRNDKARKRAMAMSKRGLVINSPSCSSCGSQTACRCSLTHNILQAAIKGFVAGDGFEYHFNPKTGGLERRLVENKRRRRDDDDDECDPDDDDCEVDNAAEDATQASSDAHDATMAAGAAGARRLSQRAKESSGDGRYGDAADDHLMAAKKHEAAAALLDDDDYLGRSAHANAAAAHYKASGLHRDLDDNADEGMSTGHDFSGESSRTGPAGTMVPAEVPTSDDSGDIIANSRFQRRHRQRMLRAPLEASQPLFDFTNNRWVTNAAGIHSFDEGTDDDEGMPLTSEQALKTQEEDDEDTAERIRMAKLGFSDVGQTSDELDDENARRIGMPGRNDFGQPKGQQAGTKSGTDLLYDVPGLSDWQGVGNSAPLLSDFWGVDRPWARKTTETDLQVQYLQNEHQRQQERHEENMALNAETAEGQPDEGLEAPAPIDFTYDRPWSKTL